MSSMSKFALEERVASCLSFFLMYSHALSTGIVVNSDTTSKETKTSLSSILISDNSLENRKELATVTVVVLKRRKDICQKFGRVVES